MMKASRHAASPPRTPAAKPSRTPRTPRTPAPGACPPGVRATAPGNGDAPFADRGAHVGAGIGTHVGVALGLALTTTRGRPGATAATVECLPLAGRGKLILTGNLLGSARDAAQLAVSLARARADRLGIDPALFLRTDFHFHVMDPLPPKGGPSIGLPMFVALVSALTRTPVDRTFAFTGELSLTGRVLPVEGLAHKARAAARAGITTLYAPSVNIAEVSGKRLPKGVCLAPTDTIDAFMALSADARPSP